MLLSSYLGYYCSVRGVACLRTLFKIFTSLNRENELTKFDKIERLLWTILLVQRTNIMFPKVVGT